MGLTKRWLERVMEDMGEEEINDEVLQRADDLLAYQIDKAQDELTGR